MKPSRLFPLIALATIVAGCGPAARPSATGKPVSPSDIIGRWRYEANPRQWGSGRIPANDGVVTIVFSAGGNFQQTVVPPAGAPPIVQAGTWKISGSSVELRDLLLWDPKIPSTHPPSPPHWVTTTISWQMVESVSRPGHLALFGSAWSWDPDSDNELERLP